MKLALNEKGLEVDAGALGKFLIRPPTLSTAPGSAKGESGEWKVDGDQGTVTYADGSVVTIKAKKSEFVCVFKDIKKGGEPRLMFTMALPVTLSEGGKYKFDEKDKKLKNFPAQVETEQFITTGISADFSFADKDGNGLTFEVKSNWYALQDNRVWRMNEYSYQFLIDLRTVSGGDFPIKIKTFKP